MLGVATVLVGFAVANAVEMVRGRGSDTADGGGVGMPLFNRLPSGGRFWVRLVLAVGMAAGGVWALTQV